MERGTKLRVRSNGGIGHNETVNYPSANGGWRLAIVSGPAMWDQGQGWAQAVARKVWTRNGH